MSIAVQRRHSAGTQLIAERSHDGPVLLLLEGRADVLSHAPDGKMVIFEQAKSGNLLGLHAAIDGDAQVTAVLARSSGRTAAASRAAFLKLLSTPSFGREIQLLLTDEIRRLSSRVFEFSTLPMRDRLIVELLRCGDGAAGGPTRLSPAPTQVDLAARIATHREAVSREMSRLRRLGLIVRQGRDLVIPSPSALARQLDASGVDGPTSPMGRHRIDILHLLPARGGVPSRRASGP